MSRKKWSEEMLFSRLLNNKSEKTYWENIRELRSRGNKKTFIECDKLYKSKNPKHREISIDVLAQLGITPRPFYKESKKIFFDLLKNEKNANVLISIFYAISHNNEKLSLENIKLITSFKNETDFNIKKALIFALLSVNQTLAIETLIFFSTDKLSDIRNWATFGIGTQIETDNKKIRNALWDRITDKDLNTRSEAIVGLANRKDSRIYGIIEIELENPNFSALIFEALLTLKARDFLQKLKKFLKDSKKEEKINQSWLKELKDCINELESVE
jgi:hypothetical protein